MLDREWIPPSPNSRLCDVLPEDWALQLELAADGRNRVAAVEILAHHQEKHPPGSIGDRWARKILLNTGLHIVRRKA